MTGVNYTALRKLLVNSIKLGNPKGTKVKTKLVTNKKNRRKGNQGLDLASYSTVRRG